MKVALLFTILIYVELTYGARYILLQIEPSYEEHADSNVLYDKEDMNEIDYYSPLREGDSNDYFVNELLDQQDDKEQDLMRDNLEPKAVHYMYQNVEQPFRNMRPPYYHDYQPRSYYHQQPFMFQNYYQPRPNYVNSFRSQPYGFQWNYGMQSVQPFYYTY